MGAVLTVAAWNATAEVSGGQFWELVWIANLVSFERFLL